MPALRMVFVRFSYGRVMPSPPRCPSPCRRGWRARSRHQKEPQMNQRALLRHGQSDDSQRARDGYSVAVKFGSAKLFPRLVTLYSRCMFLILYNPGGEPFRLREIRR